MNRVRLSLLIAAWVASATAARAADPLTAVFAGEVGRLDAGRGALTAELAALPVPAGADTGPHRGWHSAPLPSADTPAWVVVDLGRTWPVDRIGLVPASGEAETRGGPGYGFPVRFRVELADDPEFTNATAVGDFTATDLPNPGPLPVVADAGGRSGRYVRVTVTRAWPRQDDWIVALGEVTVLSGPRNVALGAKVRTSRGNRAVPTWDAQYLTDGRSLLGPPAGRDPSPSNGFLAAHSRTPGVEKWVEVDLGRAVPVDEVRLFPSRPTDFADSPGLGFPRRFRVEAAEGEAFAAPRPLFETARDDFPNPGDEVVSLPGDGRPARVVRVTATLLQDRGGLSSFGLAELQVWSGGANAALGKPVRASDVFANTQFPRWRPEYLVDGYNGRHRILDLPAWLDGLNRRRQVVDELAEVERAREAAARVAAGRAVWITAGLVGAAGLVAGGIVWRGRRTRRREVEALRARIASDLHDEVGSQLAGISLAAQLAAGGVTDPAGVRDRLEEIGQTARDATDAMRDIVWLLKSGPVTLPELIARLRETAATALRGTDHQFEAPGGSTGGPCRWSSPARSAWCSRRRWRTRSGTPGRRPCG
ncbi:MAG: histidine kinase [Isosphaera sp.]|nr:histidine kinase [Isosphaera sp.]